MGVYERNTMNINNTIRLLAEVQARRDSAALPKAHTKREASNGEAKAEWHPQGYYLYFCFHDKSIYEICSACKRTNAEVKRNLSNL
jgi:hypothetical protein